MPDKRPSICRTPASIGVAQAVLLAALFCMLAPAVRCAGAAELFDEYIFPPLTQFSSLNSQSEMLAVQTGPEGTAPVRVVAIGKDGKLRTVEEFAPDAEVVIPAAKLWIAGLGDPPAPQANPTPPPPLSGHSVAASGTAVKAPVRQTRVYLSGSGETYTVAYMGPGSYYELRHKDSSGKLLFVASPMDAYGLKTVHVSGDGSRVLVVDESAPDPDGMFEPGGPGGTGQRLYFYDRQGRLLADHDLRANLDAWLDAAGGFMAKDGSYFAATRGRGTVSGYAVTLFGEDGKVSWEKSFYATHRLVEDFGGLFRVKGGSGSLISLVDKAGNLMVMERAGYGFELWINDEKSRAYLVLFREFDVEKSGLAKRLQALFPGMEVGAVDLMGLMPRRAKRPGVAFAPGGEAFLHYSLTVERGKPVSDVSCYDFAHNNLWGGQFGHAGVIPRFVDGPRGFVLMFGYPITRLIYHELDGNKQGAAGFQRSARDKHARPAPP